MEQVAVVEDVVVQRGGPAVEAVAAAPRTVAHLLLAEFALQALHRVVDEHGAAQEVLGVLHGPHLVDGHLEDLPPLLFALLGRVEERADARRAVPGEGVVVAVL